MEISISFFSLVTLLLVQCLLNCSFAITMTNLTIDQSALLALKSHITSDPYNLLTHNWTIETSVCSWIGVTCNTRRHNRIIALDISFMGLKGIIPPEIGKLDYLRSLDLSSNQLSGIIPPEIGQLHVLEFLYLSNNNLSGIIPPEIGKLHDLEILDLPHNQLSGIIPPEIGKLHYLKGLFLAYNQLSGIIPPEIGKLQDLKSLNLSNNQLSGSFPVGMCSNSTDQRLEWLDLSYNNFSREILSSLGQCSHLQKLDMSGNKLSGIIPPEIGKLPDLWSLDLSHNQLSGSFFVDMCSNSTIQRFKWQLDLSYNNFSREILSSLGQCSHLQHLYISGIIPPEIWKLHDLESLDLSNNQLSGIIPPEIEKLSDLMFLDLSSNQLSGFIPQEIGKLQELKSLNLKANHIYGLIPTFISPCFLESLNLNSNKLQGPLPKSLLSCQKLQVIDIGGNEIRDSFPFWMETLPKLRVLILRSNRFHGTISHSLKHKHPFPMLQVFDVSRNDFIGPLPTEYLNNFIAIMNVKETKTDTGDWFSYHQESITLVVKGLEFQFERVLETFTTIDLSNNSFHGNIHHSIGKLNSLLYLNLSQNNLTGQIPTSIGDITSLESLDLSSNQLIGEIPWQLARLTFLSKLNLSQNHLVGPIPQSGGHLITFDNSSYLGNSKLCGFPLTKKCKEVQPLLPSLPQQDVDSGFLDGFTWQVVLMGYVCGFFFGITAGCYIFSYGRPRWFVNLFFVVQ